MTLVSLSGHFLQSARSLSRRLCSLSWKQDGEVRVLALSQFGRPAEKLTPIFPSKRSNFGFGSPPLSSPTRPVYGGGQGAMSPLRQRILYTDLSPTLTVSTHLGGSREL